MRKRFKKKPRRIDTTPKFRTNEQIRVPMVFVIDEEGKSLGEMETRDALNKAKESDLDLIEVSPKANPPVCKIMDYGKYQYKQSRQQRVAKSKQKKVETKGIRIGLRTDSHDLEIKKKQTEKFLKKGNKVKVEIVLRGREKAHQDLARENIQKFLGQIESSYKIEEEIKRFPGGFNVILSPEQEQE